MDKLRYKHQKDLEYVRAMVGFSEEERPIPFPIRIETQTIDPD